VKSDVRQDGSVAAMQNMREATENELEMGQPDLRVSASADQMRVLR
jgi:hypothetical protein